MIVVPGFEGRRVAVFGLGRSGLPAARSLRAGGAEPVLWDDSVSSRLQAEAEGFLVEDLSRADWSRFAALVLAPGVPLTHPAPHWTVVKAKAAGVPVIGDIELFARAIAARSEGDRPKVIAVTGTNGKSTTTALIGWVLKQAGRTTHVGGNIGVGVLALPEPTPDAVYVIEVSSYQLDLTGTFAPDVAILTNISPDHLDRHGGMEGYVAAKRRVFQALGPDAVAVISVDDAHGRAIADGLMDRRVVAVSVSDPSPLGGEGVMRSMTDEGAGAASRTSTSRTAERTPSSEPLRGPPSPPRGEGLHVAGRLLMDSEQFLTDLSTALSLPGRHNAQNAACAYAAVSAIGLTPDEAVRGLQTFPGLAHRMETVGRLDRTVFVNDSKATNVDAARQALSSYARVYWIAGGRAKDGGIASLADLFPRVAHAWLIGEAAESFAADIGDAAPVTICGDMQGAVEAAAREAESWGEANGDESVVLLSPAAASFDQYPDFEARGEAFRAAVLALGATRSVLQGAAL